MAESAGIGTHGSRALPGFPPDAALLAFAAARRAAARDRLRRRRDAPSLDDDQAGLVIDAASGTVRAAGALVGARLGAHAGGWALLRHPPAPDEPAARWLARAEAEADAALPARLGAAWQRLQGMLQRYYEGRIPLPRRAGDAERTLREAARDLAHAIRATAAPPAASRSPGERPTRHAGDGPAAGDTRLDPRTDPCLDARLDAHLDALEAFLAALEAHAEATAPWRLVRRRDLEGTAEPRLATALYAQAEAQRLLAIALWPALPALAEALAARLGLAASARGAERHPVGDAAWDPTTVQAAVLRWGWLRPGAVIRPGPPILGGPAPRPRG